MEKERLLIIVPTLKAGGQERVAVNTARIMEKRFEVMVVVFDAREPFYEVSSNAINLNIPTKKSYLSKVINVIKRAEQLRKYKEKYNIHYSLSFGTTANLSNVMSKSADKIIISIRGYGSVSKDWLSKRVYSSSDLIIGCSEIIKDSLIKIIPKMNGQIKCLYNPLNIVNICTRGEESVSDFEFAKDTIISVGRLEKVKNFHRLIKAFAIICKKNKNVQLLIIGEGSYRKNLEDLIVTLKLKGKVFLIGHRQNPFAYISKSKLFVLSSFSEGFPNALIEAMCFIPVVSVDCQTGPSEILCKEKYNGEVCEVKYADFGILVPQASSLICSEKINNDDEILAEGIHYMLNNDDVLEKYKKKAQERVNDFSEKKYENKLASLLYSTKEVEFME